MNKHLSKIFLAGILALLVLPLTGEAKRAASPAKTADTRMARISSADAEFSKKFDELSINLHPGSEYKSASKSTPQSLAHCKSIVYQTINSLPQTHTSQLTDLTLYFTDSGRRGLGGQNSVIIRCAEVTDAELAAVFTHEAGHLVDAGILNGSSDAFQSEFKDFEKPVFENDPSVDFYRMSWQDASHQKEKSSPLDFVSGYAATDAFEDFAETYAFYILHGSEFRLLKASNSTLRAKYEFMKNQVFEGREFGFGVTPKYKILTYFRNYDVTVLDYDLQTFFAGRF